MKLLIEAFFVGILTVIVGNIMGAFVGSLMKVDLPEICKDWNRYYTMEISLFLTGFFIHIICELSGINKWYCKNGLACIY